MMMMRLIQSCTPNSRGNHGGITRLFRVLSFSTQTLSSVNASSSPVSASRDNLYSRISPLGDPNVSLLPILDQWVEERGDIDRSELQRTIKMLRQFKRFTQALQVSEWMSNRSYPDLLPGDVAIQLNLISRVHGLEQAEQYFAKIPNDRRDFRVFCALLSCYAHATSLDKAEATMQKIQELGFAKGPLPYICMLNIYSQLGNTEKLDLLVHEMEEKGISFDKLAFNIQIKAYATVSDIKKMEMTLKKMEADPMVSMDCKPYFIAANGYLKAGLIEKAFAVLKKSEHLITYKTRKLACEMLMTLYSRMGKKDEVYRVWNLCKKTGKVYNMSYLAVMSSLLKLGDLDGMVKIFEEWEATKTYVDLRIYNLLISGYCRNGLLDKAESVINMILESRKEPDAYTWNHLAVGYSKHNLMEKAVDAMKKAILISDPRWNPDLATLSACFEYLNGKGDVEAMDFRTLLEEKGHFSIDMNGRLERCNKNGNPGSDEDLAEV
ncbi:hypothetical protein NMG60_11035578 [Bertholletia excelsa]